MSRRAFTLVELVVAMALAGSAAACMIATVTRQQRFHSSAAAILDTRSQLRDAADVLVTDLRGAASGILGMPVAMDSAVEFYATIASSAACAALSDRSVALPPMVLASGSTPTSLLAQPDTGDLALIYGIPSGSPDSGSWQAIPVASFSARSLSMTCPGSTGFTTALDASTGASGFVAILESPPRIPLRAGALVHFVRRSRYSLYRSTDSKWYLGYRRCGATGLSACAGIQPVAGPYRPYGPAAPGLSFRYYDAGGSAVSAGPGSTAVARIDIVIRGQAGAGSALWGDQRTEYRDSVLVTVAPRNRWR